MRADDGMFGMDEELQPGQNFLNFSDGNGGKDSVMGREGYKPPSKVLGRATRAVLLLAPFAAPSVPHGLLLFRLLPSPSRSAPSHRPQVGMQRSRIRMATSTRATTKAACGTARAS
jgi:hypothetical protein